MEVTRSTTSSLALVIIAKGITLNEADVDDSSSVIKTFSGALVIFAVTDFWAPFFAPSSELSKIFPFSYQFD